MTARAPAAVVAVLLLASGACASGEEAGTGPDTAMPLAGEEHPRSPGTELPVRAESPGVAGAGGSGVVTSTVDEIVADMQLPNDVPLAGVPTGPGWTRGPGYVTMGNDPRGTRTPSWWTPSNQRFKSDAYWNVVIPWLVIFDGVGNEAANTRVEMKGLALHVKSKATRQWKLVQSTSQIGGELYPKHLQGEDTVRPDRRESTEATSVKPPGGNLLFHGWGSKRAFDAPDLGAIVVAVKARLIVDDPGKPDDRARAKYLIHVGGDYYPDAATNVNAFAPSNYNPGIGVSRAKLVTSEWRSFSFASIDVGVQDPGGAAISEAELRAEPPPLE
jgi:hypothetical protein